MIYKTSDFIVPTGGIMIYSEYNSESKELIFKISRGYYYPQDMQNSINSINANSFIKDNNTFFENIQDAEDYLKSKNIFVSFEEFQR